MIVLAITAILLTSVIVTINNLMVLNKKIEIRSKAQYALDSEIEAIRAADFDSVLDNTTFPVTDVTNGVGTINVETQLDGTEQTDIKRVDILITWPWKNGPDQSIKASTYIVKKGAPE